MRAFSKNWSFSRMVFSALLLLILGFSGIALGQRDASSGSVSLARERSQPQRSASSGSVSLTQGRSQPAGVSSPAAPPGPYPAPPSGAYSSSSSYSRYPAGAEVTLSSREVAVEEFINYHHHQLAPPKAGEAVALDLRWGSDRLYLSYPEAVLQVGLSAVFVNDREHLPPLNLALVIDKSGSMADEGKISKVKEALLTMVSQLRETDVLSIITFDYRAQVLLPARRLADKWTVNRIIEEIQPEGSTNLYDGLMLGYREALKNYRKDATNRVILLTDGIANVGIIDPHQIIKDSLAFNDRGIDLSTIGVGLDLNQDMLRQLAKSGRGLFHFVADNGDIQKVFIDELQGLISPVARQAQLEIDYDPDLELAHLYGYDPRFKRNGFTLKLDDMNHGLTQVVIMKFRLRNQRPEKLRLPVRVRLFYYDVEQKKEVMKAEEAFVTLQDCCRPGGILEDNEVRKNYTIACMAQAIRDMAAAWEARNFRQAENLVNAAISEAYGRYPTMQDKDISYILNILQNYQGIIREHNQGWRD